jgi:phage shock protein PspC (stress-responsive transcriptional regulator)
MNPPPGGFDPAVGGPRTSSGDGFFNSIRRIGLVRTDDRWVGGVAGGLAQRLGWDPLLVRGLLFLSFFLTGLGLVAYAIGWALLPEQKDGRIHIQQAIRGDFDIALVGAIVAFIGGWANISGPFNWWRFAGWDGWGWIAGLFWFAAWTVAIVLLVRYLVRRHREGNFRGAPSPYPVPGSPVPPVPPAAAPTHPYVYPSTYDAAAHAQQAAANAQQAAANAQLRAQEAAARAQERTAQRAAERANRAAERAQYRAQRAGVATVGVVVGLILLTGALLLAAGRADFRFPAPLDGSYQAGLLWLGISLTVVGAAIVVTGIRGRRTGWLGVFAIVGLVAAVPWSIGSATLDDDRGPVNVAFENWPDFDNAVSVQSGTTRPTSLADAEDGFRVRFGDPTIDLTGLDFTDLADDGTLTVPVQLQAGDVTIVVPAEVAVTADVRLLAGSINWQVDGADRTYARIGNRILSLGADSGGRDGPGLHLLVSAGAGNVTIKEN